MTLVSLEYFYVLIGAVFAVVAGRCLRDRTRPNRAGAAAFWGLLAATYLFGRVLPPVAIGYTVLALVVLAALRQVRPPQNGGGEDRRERIAEAQRLGNRLFHPALLVPGGAVAGSLLLGRIRGAGWQLADPKQVTLIALGLGALLAIGWAVRITRARPLDAVHEGGRLVESIGWALILPQMLAALGGIFTAARVGEVLNTLVARALPTQFPFVAVAAYCLGMMLFTMCLGNAFAAFAVITSGIGVPLIVQQHHGDAAIMAALGMLSGYCGTLLTPMAANFNLVPAMLLELKDRNGVIKAQAPVALGLIVFNIVLMYATVFRFHFR